MAESALMQGVTVPQPQQLPISVESFIQTGESAFEATAPANSALIQNEVNQPESSQQYQSTADEHFQSAPATQSKSSERLQSESVSHLLQPSPPDPLLGSLDIHSHGQTHPQLPGATPQHFFLSHGGWTAYGGAAADTPVRSTPSVRKPPVTTKPGLKSPTTLLTEKMVSRTSKSIVGTKYDSIWFIEREKEKKWLEEEARREIITTALTGLANMATPQLATAALPTILQRTTFQARDAYLAKVLGKNETEAGTTTSGTAAAPVTTADDSPFVVEHHEPPPPPAPHDDSLPVSTLPHPPSIPPAAVPPALSTVTNFYPPSASVHDGLGLTARGSSILRSQLPHLADLVVAAEESMDRYGDEPRALVSSAASATAAAIEQTVAAASAAAAAQGKPVGVIARRRIEGAPSFSKPQERVRRSIWTDESMVTKVVDPVPKLSGFRISAMAIAEEETRRLKKLNEKAEARKRHLRRLTGNDSTDVLPPPAPLVFDLTIGPRPLLPAAPVPDEPFSDAIRFPEQKYPSQSPTLHEVLSLQPLGLSEQSRPIQPHIPISFKDQVRTVPPLALKSSMSIWPSLEESLQPVPFNIHLEQPSALSSGGNSGSSRYAATARDITPVHDLVHIRPWHIHHELASTQLSHYIPRPPPSKTPGIGMKYDYHPPQLWKKKSGSQTARPRIESTEEHKSAEDQGSEADPFVVHVIPSMPSSTPLTPTAADAELSLLLESDKAIGSESSQTATDSALLPADPSALANPSPQSSSRGSPTGKRRKHHSHKSKDHHDSPSNPSRDEAYDASNLRPSSATSAAPQGHHRSPSKSPPHSRSRSRSISPTKEQQQLKAQRAHRRAQKTLKHASLQTQNHGTNAGSTASTAQPSPAEPSAPIVPPINIPQARPSSSPLKRSNESRRRPSSRWQPSDSSGGTSAALSPRTPRPQPATEAEKGVDNQGVEGDLITELLLLQPNPDEIKLLSANESINFRHGHTRSRSETGFTSPKYPAGFFGSVNMHTTTSSGTAKSSDGAHRMSVFEEAELKRHDPSTRWQLIDEEYERAKEEAPAQVLAMTRVTSEVELHATEVDAAKASALNNLDHHATLESSLLETDSSDDSASELATSGPSSTSKSHSAPRSRSQLPYSAASLSSARWQRRLAKTEAKHDRLRAAAEAVARAEAEEQEFESELEGEEDEPEAVGDNIAVNAQVDATSSLGEQIPVATKAKKETRAERRRKRALRLQRHASMTMEEKAMADALDIDQAAKELDQRLAIVAPILHPTAPSTIGIPGAVPTLMEIEIRDMKKKDIEDKMRKFYYDDSIAASDRRASLILERRASLTVTNAALLNAVTAAVASDKTDEVISGDERPHTHRAASILTINGEHFDSSTSPRGTLSSPRGTHRNRPSVGRSGSFDFSNDSTNSQDDVATDDQAPNEPSTKQKHYRKPSQLNRQKSTIDPEAATVLLTSSSTIPSATTGKPTKHGHHKSRHSMQLAHAMKTPALSLARKQLTESRQLRQIVAIEISDQSQAAASKINESNQMEMKTNQAEDEIKPHEFSAYRLALNRPPVLTLPTSGPPSATNSRPSSSSTRVARAGSRPSSSTSSVPFSPRPDSTLYHAIGFTTSRPSTSPHVLLSPKRLTADATPWQTSRFAREMRRQEEDRRRQWENARRVQQAEEERILTLDQSMRRQIQEQTARGLSTPSSNVVSLVRSDPDSIGQTSTLPHHPPPIQPATAEVISSSFLYDKSIHHPINRLKVRQFTGRPWTQREREIWKLVARVREMTPPTSNHLTPKVVPTIPMDREYFIARDE